MEVGHADHLQHVFVVIFQGAIAFDHLVPLQLNARLQQVLQRLQVLYHMLFTVKDAGIVPEAYSPN